MTRHLTPSPVTLPAPVPSERPVTLESVKWEIVEHCAKCQQPGGSMATLVTEVRGIAADVKSAFKILDERRGRQQVWSVLRAVLIPVFCVTLAWWLTYDADKRNTIMLKRQADIAEAATEQIKKAGEKSTQEVEKLTKELGK